MPHSLLKYKLTMKLKRGRKIRKFFFILTTILAIIMVIHIYVSARFDLYSLQYPSQILIGVFLLLGGLNHNLLILFILFGEVIMLLYFVT